MNQLTPAMLETQFWKILFKEESVKLSFEERTKIVERYRKLMKDKRKGLEAQKRKIEELLKRPDEWLEM